MVEGRRISIRKSPRKRLCYIALIIFNSLNYQVAESLKLNPVVPLPIKLDIIEEAENVLSSFFQAKSLISHYFDTQEKEFTLKAINLLRATTNRWKSIEHKLASTISNDNLQTMKIFDETVNRVASLKMFLGKLLIEANELEIATKEFENSCPTIIEYQLSRKYLDTEEWFECLSIQSELYMYLEKYKEIEELNDLLLNKMPWLSALNISKKKNIEESSSSLVQTLILLSKEDRKYISSELATSLIVSERMRSDLQDAAKEFVNAEGYDKQFKVFQRTENFLAKIVKEYNLLSPNSMRENGQPIRRSIDYSDLEFKISLVNKKKIDMSSKDRIFKEFKLNLGNQIKQEGSLYLNTMKGLLDKGRSYIQAAQSKVKSLQASYSNDAEINLPAAFQSISEVLAFFQKLQVEAKLLKDAKKSEKKIKSENLNVQKTKNENSDYSFISYVFKNFWNIIFSIITLILMLSIGGQPATIKSRGKTNTKNLSNLSNKVKEEPELNRTNSIHEKIFQNIIYRTQFGFQNLLSIVTLLLSSISSVYLFFLLKYQSFFSKPLPEDVVFGDQSFKESMNSISFKKSKLNNSNNPTKKVPKSSSNSKHNNSNSNSPRKTANVSIDAIDQSVEKAQDDLAADISIPTDNSSYLDDFSDGEWIKCESNGILKKPKSPQTQPRIYVASKPNNVKNDVHNKNVIKNVQTNKIKGANLQKNSTNENKPAFNLKKTETISSYSLKKKDADMHSDGSGGTDGNTSEESEETLPIYHETEQTSSSVVSQNSQQNYASNLATTKLRKLLSISTDSQEVNPSAALNQSLDSNSQFVENMTHPVYPIHLVPGPDGSPTPMVLVNGLYYLIPPQSPSYQPPDISSQGIPLIPQQLLPINYFPNPTYDQSRLEIVNLIRNQIEYYFSDKNLPTDNYLKSLMDPEGYVRMDQIMPFNRIRKCSGGDPYLVLEAIQSSEALDLLEPWAVKNSRGNFHATSCIAPEIICLTKIRAINQPS